MSKRVNNTLLICLLAASLVAVGAPVLADNSAPASRESARLGETVERQLPTLGQSEQWIQDKSIFDTQQGDRIETEMVLEQEARTEKLQNVVPAIHFESGEAQIPDSYVELIREALEGVKDRRNVRLHFVGHTDDQALSPALTERYGDNVGLSRERAGTTAEYFQRALNLPPESISYEGVGDSQPLASNSTAEGRRQNRRVEVEVWYDEISEKLVEKEVVVSEEIHRIKVCRIETVCKLRYKEGHSNRARVRNLIAPLHYDEDSADIPPEFLAQIRQAVDDLAGKGNLVVKFIGHTDDRPLDGRQARIYGTHLGLSKARARRVALAVQEALKLPSSAIDSDGRGSEAPIASNGSASGRAVNRRIEVEFWHDDPLQQLPDEPQMCPESAGAEIVTRVYDPPSGPIRPIIYQNGDPVIVNGYAERLARLMEEVSDKTNVRLRFVGYTSNERLDRRTARVYGDDIGLSAARARRAAEQIQAALQLDDGRIESEGRGYVQSDDVVNAGFIESDISRVAVEVIYDELASLDDSDGVEITRLTREVEVQNPFALNLMRISVDGKPISDPGKHTADIQRCTDVALDRADIQFKYDSLEQKPRLNVSAWPKAIRYRDLRETDAAENRVWFSAYSNYPSFFSKAEVRLFEDGQSTQDEPLAVLEINSNGRAEWWADFEEHRAPSRKLKYLLRVYDSEGRFDETEAQPLWVVNQVETVFTPEQAERELLAGYGENRLRMKNIPISGGTIEVNGTAIPEGHSVWAAGEPVPVDGEGKFVSEQIIPAGMHTVEVAVLDRAGNGELFLRDLEMKGNDWFYVGIADVTVARDETTGPARLVTQDETHYENELNVDGRLAFYLNGKVDDQWKLTASADTREGPIDEIFSNFMDKSPDALFRRIDPDYFSPTYGDDSTVEETAPTLGKFYVKASNDRNYGLWGNFKIGYYDSELARVDRGLYGANLHYESLDTTDTGESRLLLDGFAAEPGTVASREEFRGTGGSLYFLRHQDVLVGSERVQIEIRDKDSGIVTAVKHLTPVLDYDIDHFQGRILLNEPLQGTADDGMLVDSAGMSGDSVYLVVRYEFTPGFEEIDTLAVGGRGHYWLNDHIKLGATSYKSEEADNESTLSGADLTLKTGGGSWFKFELSQTEGPGTLTQGSDSGGFDFFGGEQNFEEKAAGHRIDASVELSELYKPTPGNLTFYHQELEAGYSAPGLVTNRDLAQFGATYSADIGERISLRAKADSREEDQGLLTRAGEVDLSYALNEHWSLAAGARHDLRRDNSLDVPVTQEHGERSDLKIKGTYDSRQDWLAYGFVQDSVNTTGNRPENGRVGAGGDYQVNERLKLRGEVSGGDLGTAGRFGTDYLLSDRTTVYLNYGLENERTDNGVRARRGDITSGFKTRYSDSTSIYLEEKYSFGEVPTGLIHSTGVDFAPSERWNFGASLALGTLQDYRTAAETERKSIALNLGYGFDTLSVASAVEYLENDVENPQDASISTRTTWLTKNSLKYQLNPSWRMVAKLNHADSESSLGEFFDGNYTEAVFGYAYRPVNNNRWNALAKYTYFFNKPSAAQTSVTGTSAADYSQKSHIASLDLSYALTPRWTLGGKYARRHAQVSMDRVNPQYFDSTANLYVLRADWHVVRKWDVMLEGRLLDLPDAGDQRSGAVLGVYRHVGNHMKMGAGYSFADFSDDLTELDYDSRGFFINLIGKL